MPIRIKSYSKFQNEPTWIDGYRFASKKEATRYTELKLLLRAGEIQNLEVQPVYPIFVNNVKVCDYVADFAYCVPAIGGKKEIVEDVKGFRTQVFQLKKKLFAAQYGFKVKEIR
jgi:hypothetical protein